MLEGNRMGQRDSDSMDRGGRSVRWLFERWRKTFAAIDKERIGRFVRRIEQEHPNGQDDLVRRVVRQSARLSAVLGAVAAAPALSPGLGTAISLVAMAPEEMLLIRLKCVLMLRIAAIYGFDPAAPERLTEILVIAGAPTRFLDALGVAKDDLQRLAARVAVVVGRRSSEATEIGTKALSRGALRRLPALGFLAGSAINYWSFHALGRQASKFYRELREGSVNPRGEFTCS